MEYIPLCDQSKQRHEQIVTDDHFSSSASSVDSLSKQKEVMLQRVPIKDYLFYILNLSPRNVVL
jgi:hypothetical protein